MHKALSPFEEDERRRSKMGTRTVRAARRFNATPAQVFEAWIDPDIARQWLFATAQHQVARLDVDARIGGRFRALDIRDGASANYVGQYLEIVSPRRLAFTLALPESTATATCVSVAIAAVKAGAKIALVHEDVPAALASGMKMRWAGMLYGLALLLEARARQSKNFDRRHCRFQPPP